MNVYLSYSDLEKLFRSPSLPGTHSHKKLAPAERPLAPPSEIDRRAAVLILLFPDKKSGELCLPLIRRPDHDTYHAGQIALPGGRHEGGEEFPVETALRETREELGIPEKSVHPVGTLSPLYVGVSNITVMPVVAYAEERPRIEPDPSEVAAHFFLPLSQLYRKPLWTTFDARDEHIRAPYYPTDAGKVWGATAMILSELIALLKRWKDD